MLKEIKTNKRKFSKALEPLKVLLVHKESILDKPKWLKFVEMTRSSVIKDPEQYLGTELSRKKVLAIKIVNLIFDEFIEQRKLRWQHTAPDKLTEK